VIDKLRRKFISVALISVSIVIVIIMVVLNLSNYRSTVSKADKTLSLLIDNDGTFPVPPKEMDGPGTGAPERKDFSPESPFESRYFSVHLDDDGKVIDVNTDSIAAVTEEQAAKYALSAAEKDKKSGFIGNYRYECSGSLIVFLDATRDLESFRSFLGTSITVAAAGLLCVFFLVLFFSKLAMKPIALSMAKQKRFITDASHEIRTPLTIIDANTEVIEMTTGENEWTRSTRAQIARLTELTKSLVSLSRMDEGTASFKPAEFSISDAASDTAQQFEAPALIGSKEFDKEIEPGLRFCGDEKKIRQLLFLLLDNALKYSPPDGWIRFSLKSNGRKVTIEVSNSVTSISKGSHDQVFDRFMRMDSSRNSAIPGYGLGLSIAQSIVELHKGRITAFSPDDKSFCIQATIQSL